MSKKAEIPKDFDLNEIMGGKSNRTSDTKINKSAEDVDKDALLESMAKQEINNIPLQKEEQTKSDTLNTANRPTQKTIPTKQRKASLLDYQQTFLSVPRITDRKTVFISNHLRERIVSIVRRLGTEKSSVSGFIENLVIHHLDEYREDIERWKKL